MKTNELVNQLLAGNHLNDEEIKEAKELIYRLENSLRKNLPKFTPEDFTKISNDVNGNPRYVCHFLKFSNNYNEALKIARKFGGGKFHNKQYGGGIKFQEYSIQDLCNQLNKEVI